MNSNSLKEEYTFKRKPITTTKKFGVTVTLPTSMQIPNPYKVILTTPSNIENILRIDIYITSSNIP
jgi:hypothetical protein